MIYFLQAGKNGPIKIGYTNNDIESRISQLQTGCPYELKLLWQVDGGPEKESEIHIMFSDDRLRGEWFNPTEKLLLFINEYSNDYEIILKNKELIHIEEHRDNIHISHGGVSIDLKKEHSSIFSNIDSYYEINLDINDGSESEYFIECDNEKINIYSDDNEMFGGINILLSGKKVVK